MKSLGPLIGVICLGMPLFSNFSEQGNIEDLGRIDARAVKFDNETVLNPSFKIHHMYGDTLEHKGQSVWLNGVEENEEFHFCLSYHFVFQDEAAIVRCCQYAYKFKSSVEKGNIHGVQFHPEKSQYIGFKMIQKFLSLHEKGEFLSPNSLFRVILNTIKGVL